MKTKKIGFIGGGNMAASLIKGLIASGHSAQLIWVADVDTEKLHTLGESLGVNTLASNEDVINVADVVVLAVKPQVLRSVAVSTAKLIQQKNLLVVSIAAGVNQSTLSRWLGDQVAIVRCMPNTPALVLTGATALHSNVNVTDEQRNLAENIMRAVGLALWVDDESELDAVTAVSGSGPAYFFLLMEEMEKVAIEMGLSENKSRLLVQQTALGAAKIALESIDSPAVLRRRVTSPGGTTQSALDAFQQGGFENLVQNALHAARNRSIQMSSQIGEDS